MNDLIPHIHRWSKVYKPYFAQWSATQKSWLLNTGSLTKRLIAASQHSFEVKVLREGVAAVYPHEKRSLQSSQGDTVSNAAWVREVLLYVDSKPWVFARSVIPVSTLSGQERKLRHLGKKPLGHLLFSSPRYQRSHFEIGSLTGHELKHQIASDLIHLPDAASMTSPHRIWGRRSVFSPKECYKPILVSETFLPIVFD